MATISENNKFTVILHFETKKGKQDEFLERIGKQVTETIMKFPGFISSSFLKGNDGKTIINYAQWESAEHYKNFRDIDLEDTEQIFKEIVDVEEEYHPLEVVHVFEN